MATLLPPLPFTLYQGVRYDHSSVSCALGGITYLIKALNHEDGMDPAVIFANSAAALGFTRGQYKSTGSVELWTAEANQFEVDLYNNQDLNADGSKAGFLEILFPIAFIYKPEGGLDVWSTLMYGCRVIKRTTQTAQGNEGHSVKFDLAILNIVKNGVPAIADQALSAPGTLFNA